MQDKKEDPKVRDPSTYDMLVITPLATMALLWLFTYMTAPRVLTANEARETLGGVIDPCDTRGPHTVFFQTCSTNLFACDTFCNPCNEPSVKNEIDCKSRTCWRCDHGHSITQCVYYGGGCDEFGGGTFWCGTKWAKNCFWNAPSGPCMCPDEALEDVGDCNRDNCAK